MKYQLALTEEARKDLSRLVGHQLSRAENALKAILENPFIGKALKGELHGLRSYRFGDHRIIYEIVKRKILIIVLKIGHRKDVYR